MESDLRNLPKRFVEELKELGITKFTIALSGGSDEGYVNVYFDTDIPIPPTNIDPAERLTEAIEAWAYDTADYSGAGDGIDYGDDYVFDLAAGTMEHSYWSHERVDGKGETKNIRIV